MATVQQIINYATRYYPNAVSDANLIIDIDTIHKAVYNRIIRQKNIYTLETGYTVADQLTVTIPTTCLPENIIKIEISSDITGSIDDDTVWQEYERKSLNETIDSGYIWGVVNSTTIILAVDGEPIDTTNYEIRYYFYPNPTALTAVTDTPDLDAEYHDLLYFGLIQTIASQGQNPDTEVANYYQKKFDERIMQIEESMRERYDNAPIELDRLESRW